MAKSKVPATVRPAELVKPVSPQTQAELSALRERIAREAIENEKRSRKGEKSDVLAIGWGVYACVTRDVTPTRYDEPCTWLGLVDGYTRARLRVVETAFLRDTPLRPRDCALIWYAGKRVPAGTELGPRHIGLVHPIDVHTAKDLLSQYRTRDELGAAMEATFGRPHVPGPDFDAGPAPMSPAADPFVGIPSAEESSPFGDE